MNITLDMRSNYKILFRWRSEKTKPKQTQFKPNKANFKPNLTQNKPNLSQLERIANPEPVEGTNPTCSELVEPIQTQLERSASPELVEGSANPKNERFCKDFDHLDNNLYN